MTKNKYGNNLSRMSFMILLEYSIRNTKLKYF